MNRLKKAFAILFYLLQKIFRAFKAKDNTGIPETRRKNENVIEHYQLLDELKASVDKEVVIQSKKLSHLYQNQIKDINNEFSGKILEIDDDWIKLELNRTHLTQDRSPDYLYFKTKVIIDFSIKKKNLKK